MRFHTVVGMIVGAFAMLALATPAAAQGAKVDFSGGYQYFRFLEEGSVNVPQGWGASVGVGKEWIKFVADVGGHYIEGEQLHTFQGGLELSGKNQRVVPFARVLSGVGLFTGYGSTNSVFVFTPEAGVKIMATNRVGAQVSVGFPVLVNDGSANGFRFFAGIVYRK
jgi:hypothetical protein